MKAKLITFDPCEPKTQARTKNPNNRTSQMLSLILREEGATLDEVCEAMNKSGNKKLTTSTVRTWLCASYLAPRGIGCRSQFEGEQLRVFGFRHGEPAPKVSDGASSEKSEPPETEQKPEEAKPAARKTRSKTSVRKAPAKRAQKNNAA